VSEPPREHARTLLALAVGGVAIGFAAIFFRLAEPTDPLLASALRLGLAGTLLSPAIVSAVRSGALDRRALRAGVLGGLLYAVHFGTWVASLELTTVAASVTLVTATPLLLAVIAALRGRDRPPLRTWLAIAGATLGAALIGGADALEVGPRALAGDGLAMAGALAMAFYLLLVRDLATSADGAPAAPPPALAFSGLAALSGAAWLGLGVVVRLPIAPIAMPSSSALFFIALAALVPQLVGHTALTWALRRATPTEVGLATAVEPALSTVLAWLVFAERPSLVVGLGALVTLGSVVAGVGTNVGGGSEAR
jgi:drug/metabolite transporter (DMT)-like permease